MRVGLAILLLASGCDALFGLREVRLDPDARRDGALDGKLDGDVRPDGSIDAAGKGCANDGLTCSNVTLYQTTAGCYAACQDQVTFAIASGRCVAWGGALATFEVAQDDTLLQIQMTDTTTFWMGMQQLASEPDPSSGWMWSNGHAVVNARWYKSVAFGDQPDDGSDKIENGEEQCGWYSTLGWGDGNCAAGFQFLCKK